MAVKSPTVRRSRRTRDSIYKTYTVKNGGGVWGWAIYRARAQYRGIGGMISIVILVIGDERRIVFTRLRTVVGFRLRTAAIERTKS